METTPKPNILPKLDQDRGDALAPLVAANMNVINSQRSREDAEHASGLGRVNTLRILGGLPLAALVVGLGINAIQYNHSHQTPSTPTVLTQSSK